MYVCIYILYFLSEEVVHDFIYCIHTFVQVTLVYLVSSFVSMCLLPFLLKLVSHLSSVLLSNHANE
jgi:hypothetical protein